MTRGTWILLALLLAALLLMPVLSFGQETVQEGAGGAASSQRYLELAALPSRAPGGFAGPRRARGPELVAVGACELVFPFVVDRACSRRYDAQVLNALGYPDAAVALMCQDGAVRRAMEEAGTPCPPGKEKAAPGGGLSVD